jgi:hypothetical protein
MIWSYNLAYFFVGAFLANGVPHLVQGTLSAASPRAWARSRRPYGW